MSVCKYCGRECDEAFHQPNCFEKTIQILKQENALLKARLEWCESFILRSLEKPKFPEGKQGDAEPGIVGKILLDAAQ